MVNQIFLNLPVKDISKTIHFFKNIGFSFDQTYTDENATCMIIGENIYAMLLVEKFFKTFTSKEICDTKVNTEFVCALSVESRNKVDEIIDRVLLSGGSEPRAVQDHGFMYGRSFQDIDGHLWEVFYMENNSKN